MKILKTYYYPLDVKNKQIIDDPQKRERAVASKYRARGLIGIKGIAITQHKCYQEYTITKP